MKTLIAYFSHAGENYFDGGLKNLKVGNAKIIAEKTAKLTGGVLFEIETIKTYPNGYKACCNEAMKEKKSNELPELKNYLPSIDEFNKIILVYPCWWGTMPQAVVGFLKHYNLNGKQILPICTHEGSGMGSSEADLKKLCPSSKIARGLAIQGTNAQNCDNELENYFKKNNM